LPQEDEERVELRLLTDVAYTEEFDTTVNELTDEYVAGEITGEERERVEEYFLTAPERRDKAKFAAALINQAKAEREVRSTASASRVPIERGKTSLLERARLFWTSHSPSWRMATATIAVAMVVGLMALLQFGRTPSPNYAFVDLSISASERAEGSLAPSVSSQVDQVRAQLRFPAQMPPARDYRVKLAQDIRKSFSPAEKQSDSITVLIPVADLRPGRNGLQLFVITPEGSEQRVPGTYLFDLK
jgi:hypothetical protein